MAAEDRAVSVSEALGLAKRALESVRLRVIGEVSEFTDKPGYRAAYFTVSDGDSAMSCLMWREHYETSGVLLRCGMLVEMTGHFSVYAPKGRMQFMVRSLEPAGEGRLRVLVAETARRLEAEGLMRPERKRPLPRYPQRIGLVTSPRGKALHDALRTLERRYPLAEILFAGVTVEGDQAVSAIVEGLRTVEKADPDLVLLVRGGGSYEDLMPFNAEELARAMAACPKPIVTGIGHEPDVSIADMVADVRASTPTAAAEAASPSLEELRSALFKIARLLGRALRHRVQGAQHEVVVLQGHPIFRESTALLGPSAQRIDRIATGLHRVLPARLEQDRHRLRYVQEGLARVGGRTLQPAESRIARIEQDLKRLGRAATGRALERVNHVRERLQDLSPEGILGRGYAICFSADGKTVARSVRDVSIGDRVSVRLSAAMLGCLVESAEEEGSDG